MASALPGGTTDGSIQQRTASIARRCNPSSCPVGAKATHPLAQPSCCEQRGVWLSWTEQGLAVIPNNGRTLRLCLVPGGSNPPTAALLAAKVHFPKFQLQFASWKLPLLVRLSTDFLARIQ